jgi:hypothetical protein
MTEEFKKCKEDILYFAENYFYFNCIDAGKVKVKLHPYQKEVLKMFSENTNSVLLASRQVGKTGLQNIFMIWTAIFNDNQNVLLITNKENTAKHIFKIIENQYELLPEVIKPQIIHRNSTSLKLDNGSYISAISSPENIRGCTIDLLCVDELAFFSQENISEFLPYIYPAPELSKNYKICISSTPKGKSGLFYEIYNGSVKGTNNWTHMKVLWNDVPGRDEEWKNRTIELLGDVSIFEKEFCCKFE